MSQSINIRKEFGAVYIGSTEVVAGGGGGGGGSETIPVGSTFTIEGSGSNRMYVDNDAVNFGLKVVSSVSTASTSNSLGSLLLAGGIGISNTTEATSATNGGTITTAGGVGIAKKLFVGGVLNASDTTSSTSNSTGAIVSAGGIGITDTTDAISATNGGAMTIAGGLAVAKKVFLGSTFNISDTTASSSSSTGAFVLSGGIGINNTTNSSSSTNGGSFTTAGGMAVAKDIWCGSNILLKTQYAAIAMGTWDASAGNPSINFFTENTGSSGTPNCRIQAYGGSGSINTGTLELNGALYNFGSSGTINVGNTTSSTANNNGAIVSAGGIGITSTTNSASSTNGGTITTAGGVGIAKDLIVGGNVQIDGSGWAIFPNRTGCGRVPNLDGNSLQVESGISVKGGLTAYNSSNQACTVWYTSGSEDINIVRNFNNVATLWTITSTAKDPNPDPLPEVGDISFNREATMALIRTDDAGNEEFVDFFNNGYFRGPYPDVTYGIRCQKRGTGTYRPFVIQFASSLADVNTALTITSDLELNVTNGRITACKTATSDPVSAGLGDEIYRTDLGVFKKWNGTAWVTITTS